MHSEWMKVMLAEVERKQLEARDGREEQQRRLAERQHAATPRTGGAETRRPRKRR
jgi:hypothetical protein